MVTKEALAEALDNLHDLPTLPSVIDKILKAANDPDTSVARLADDISVDPVLTAKILKVVNSSFYSF